MKIKALITEKSLKDAKKGRFTFEVEQSLSKYAIRDLINDIFNVHVTTVKTSNYKGRTKKTYTGKVKIIKPRKKAIVTLKDKEKIDLFEESKGK
ncbi:50S ribosomal protein L23 [Candidatus Woesebacteria bacterium RIFCSPHIGHO2_01_FULL_37_10]|uniref:50S ribosomal protein L23 n=1 Tax=Candidatus Woesebacteria bacterium RIFCSPHIGHO2_01_FULL_37_10 TaxID=1802489 RepID=A0A1F7XTL7_9BACT|nr:MAG: 50S ribosomal protein L23 [Candidatus Woesebacteria bacterium RIFCSPHIGHO2_01_FULL_37_10]